jgi:hypothetical protein
VLQFCNEGKKDKDLIFHLAREFARAAKAISKSEQLVIRTLQMQKKVGEKFQCSHIGVTEIIG